MRERGVEVASRTKIDKTRALLDRLPQTPRELPGDTRGPGPSWTDPGWGRGDGVGVTGRGAPRTSLDRGVPCPNHPRLSCRCRRPES